MKHGPEKSLGKCLDQVLAEAKILLLLLFFFFKYFSCIRKQDFDSALLLF